MPLCFCCKLKGSSFVHGKHHCYGLIRQETFPSSLLFDCVHYKKESKIGLFSFIWQRIIPLHNLQPLPFYLLDYISSVHANSHCYTNFCSTVLVLTSLSLGDPDWYQIVVWYVYVHVICLEHSVPRFVPPSICLKISNKKCSYFPVPTRNIQCTKVGCGLDAALSRTGLMSILDLLLLVFVSKDGICRDQRNF